MSDWNPSLYLHFAAERSRPAVELLARVPLENIEYVADLGCGPGNSTALLHQRWPAAKITGIDSSPAMVAEARSALPDCQFVEADIRNWQPEQTLDLIFANASLQWLPDHYELFPHLVSLLNSHGVLAVQMPDNWLEPTHVLMREVAWEQNYPDRGREPLAGVHAYYDILSEAGCEVDIWRTTYYNTEPCQTKIRRSQCCCGRTIMVIFRRGKVALLNVITITFSRRYVQITYKLTTLTDAACGTC